VDVFERADLRATVAEALGAAVTRAAELADPSA